MRLEIPETPGLDPASFAGVFKVLNPADPMNKVTEEDVVDDIEGEQETLPDLEEEDRLHVDEMLASLNASGVSRGVSDGTHDEYQRWATSTSPSALACGSQRGHSLMEQCEEFLVRKKLVKPHTFFSSTPLPHSAELIVIWIMDGCVGSCGPCSDDESNNMQV